MKNRPIASVFVLLAAIVYLHFLDLEGDTDAMIHEIHESVACLSRGQWSGCTTAGQFPLLQKIPSFYLVWLGFKTGLIQRVLACLSLVSFGGILLAAWRTLRTNDRALFLGVMLFGPILWYARSSFGEMLAAAMLFMMVASLAGSRAAIWPLLFALAAGISKETAPLFVPILALATIRARGLPLARVLPAAIGSIGAIALNSAYNYFRFGSVLNESYLQPVFLIHDARLSLSFAAGLWFSASGGIVVFWSTFALLFGLSFFYSSKNRAPWLLCALILLGLTLGFSRWAFPFGWICWGPRFFIPWIPAIAFVLIQAYGEALPRPRLSWLVAIASASFPQFFVLFDPTLTDKIFFHDGTCPVEAVITVDRAYYLKCIEHWIWPDRLAIAAAYNPAANPMAFALAFGISVILIRILMPRTGG